VADYKFYGFFVASKVGKTGLTVTVDVYDSAGVAQATGAAATEVGGGLYTYTHTDATDGDYVAVFKTSDTSVDAQHIPALAAKQISAYIDAAVSTRSTLTAAQVWANATRTLTQTAAAVASVLSGSTITIQRGDTLSVSLTGLGNITGNAKLWFTAKESAGWPDSMAMVQIERTSGLLYLNRAAPVSPVVAGDGVITVDDAAGGNITITLTARASSLLAGSGSYDVQWLDASGNVYTLTSGIVLVTDDMTRAVA